MCRDQNAPDTMTRPEGNRKHEYRFSVVFGGNRRASKLQSGYNYNKEIGTLTRQEQ
jgi:hypothetical protein